MVEEKGEGIVEIEEEKEGEHVEINDDFYFVRVGKPVPITSSSAVSSHLLETSKIPVCVSDSHRLIFLSLPSGFCGVRIEDVVDAANQINEDVSAASFTSAEKLSVFNVSDIGSVHTLALSADSSTLAVSVSGNLHFFPVNSLLHQHLKPTFSCSLDGSSKVKVFIWRKRSDTSYLVLSDQANLYFGSVGGSLKDIMDNVDAVDWSIKGTFIAVARGDTVNILSSKFNDRSSIKLPFKSWIGDSEENNVVKVDSIRWVRQDSLVLGCFQQTPDGKEENYLLQVIRCVGGKIADASCQPVVLSFQDLFLGLIDDIVAYGSGPYLNLSYLEKCGIAIAANRKNTDQHIMLLDWSLSDENETAVVDIDRDSWQPRIELQENGDDNLVMGLCVHEDFLQGKIQIEIGLDEQKEVSPICMLICVTLEGKLVMFHVASVMRGAALDVVDSSLDEEEEDTMIEVPPSSEQSNLLSIKGGKQTSDLADLNLQLQDPNKDDQNVSKDIIFSVKDIEDATVKPQELMSPLNIKPSVSGGQQQIGLTNLLPGVDVRHRQHLGQQRVQVGQSSFGTPLADKPISYSATDASKTELPKFTGFGSGPAFAGKVAPDPSLSNHNNLQKNIGPTKEALPKIGAIVAHSIQSHSLTGKKFVPEGSQGIPPFSSALSQGNRFDYSGTSFGGTNASTDLTGNNSLKETTGMSGLASLTSKPTQNVGQRGYTGAAPIASTISHGVQSQSLSGKNFVLEVSQGMPSFSSAQNEGKRFDFSDPGFGGTNASIDLTGNHSLKETPGMLGLASLTSKPAQNVVQRGYTGAGPIESIPSICRSPLSSQESLTSPPTHSPLFSKSDRKAPSMMHSMPHVSGHFFDIKEIVEELDALLKSVEEPGGFGDAFTVFQQKSVEALEERMRTLSEKCRIWKGMLDEQLEETYQLLDNTVQVVARKSYMDGILKQISDGQYWELWDRQNLSSELGLKRMHILKLNQDLTNQLIELERHFNKLELQRYGETAGPAGRKAIQSGYGPSRSTQSLNRLHNTMISQLAAAEQLCECLSKQMDMLRIESPVKTKSVQKELFEAIGIPYGTSFRSPDTAKVGDTSSSKKSLLSAASGDQFRRRQSSTMKSSDSETARRRRDSLDQSWASYEPTKTTVKRVLLQENMEKNRSLMDRQPFDPHHHNSPSTSIYPGGSKGFQHTLTKQPLEKISGPLPPESSTFPAAQQNKFGLTVSMPQTSIIRDHQLAADKFSSKVPYVGNSGSFLSSEANSTQPPEARQQHSLSEHASFPAQTTLLQKSSEKSISSFKGSLFSGSVTTTNSQKLSSKSSTEDSSSPATALFAPALPGKDSQFSAAISQSQPAENLSSPAILNSSVNSSSAIMLPSLKGTSSFATPSRTSSAAMPFSISLHSSKTSSSTSWTPSPGLVPHSSIGAPKTLTPSFAPVPIDSLKKDVQTPEVGFPVVSATLLSNSELHKTDLQASVGKFPPSAAPITSFSTSESLKTDDTPANAKSSPFGDSTLSTSEFSKMGLQKFVTSSPPSVCQMPPSMTESDKTEPQPPMAKPQLPISLTPLSVTSESPKQELPLNKVVSKEDTLGATPASHPLAGPLSFDNKLGTSLSSAPSSETSSNFASGQTSLNMTSTPPSGALNVRSQPASAAFNSFQAPISASNGFGSIENKSSDIAITEEDEMEEEAPEMSQNNELSLGGLGGFGIGPSTNTATPKANPFGAAFGITATSQASSPFTLTVPSGELFRPASFSFPSPRPSQPTPPPNSGAFSGGFGTVNPSQAPAQSAFGQPAQVGSGQQALGSVLGAFGQSRQIGTGLPGSGFASASGFGVSSVGGGFASKSPVGFSSAASGGGFTGVSPTGGGFAGLASAGGGFAGAGSSGGGGFGGLASADGGFGGVASAGGGFGGIASVGGGGGFGGAAPGGGFTAAGGGSFGAFGSQQASGGFSAFGNAQGGQQQQGGFAAFGSSTSGKPPEIFTQMRK